MRFFEQLKRRNVLRVAIAYLAAAWLLIQIVETLFPVFDLSNNAIRAVVIGLAIGFPLVLAFSWFYEFTATGLQHEQDVDHTSATNVGRDRRFDHAIVAILVAALGYFAVDKFVLDPERDAELQQQAAEQAREEALSEVMGGNRIAVLPFVNRSGNPDDEYFSDGFSDELIHMLSLDERFEVISSRSSFSFKGKDTTVPEIADQLSVTYIVDGTVRRTRSDIRIAAQLIDTYTDTPLWSGEYRLTESELYATQDQISAAIVESLQIRLSLTSGAQTSAAATASTEAHDAYLRGRHLVAQRRPDLLGLAVGQFNDAITFDPQFALGHAELAIALQMPGCSSLAEWDCNAVSAKHAQLAMQLNPNLAEAHLAMSYQGRREEGLPYLRKATELNPSFSDAYARIANIYLRMPFRNQDRINSLRQALRYDPLSRRANWDYLYSLTERGLKEESIKQIEKFEVIDPNAGKVMRGYQAALGGNIGDYILAYLDASSDGADSIAFGRYLYFDFDYQLVAIGLADEALHRNEDENPELIAWFSDAQVGADMAMARPQGNLGRDDRMTANILAHAGRYEEARPRFENVWGRGGALARNDLLTAFLIEGLITVRRIAGDEEGVAEVLAAANDVIRRFREAGMVVTHQLHYSIDYVEGITRYLEGNYDEAQRLISQAMDDGFDIPPPSPYQEERFADPRFAEIYERQKARHDRERKKVLDVVCADGFSHPVWVPLPETCAKYL